jgi:hypothetical protein
MLVILLYEIKLNRFLNPSFSFVNKIEVNCFNAIAHGKTLFLAKSYVKLTSKYSSVWSTTYLLCLMNVCFNRQSTLLRVPTVLLFIQTSSLRKGTIIRKSYAEDQRLSNTNPTKNHSWLITGFVTKLTRRVPPTDFFIYLHGVDIDAGNSQRKRK